MARIRTIKPEFPEDETLGQASREARYLFILLWTRCDDHGRFRAAPSLLRGQLYPYDDDVSTGLLTEWLDELESAGRIHRYAVDGQSYAEVVNWSKHQRVDNAGKPMVPPPNETRGDSRRLAATRGGPSPVDNCSPLDHDHDLDHDLDRAPTIPAELWITVAERKMRDAGNIRNPSAWKRTVAEQAEQEFASRAKELLGHYPQLSTGQLADVLCGDKNLLRTLRRGA